LDVLIVVPIKLASKKLKNLEPSTNEVVDPTHHSKTNPRKLSKIYFNIPKKTIKIIIRRQ
jgi:hypothetical protein